MARVRAQFDGRVFIPVEPVNLSAGDLVELEISIGQPAQLRKGSPELIRKLMHAPPRLSAEDVAELDRALEEGKLPVRYDPVFPEDESE